MTKAACESGGLRHVSKLALANCRDLLPILHWNRRHGIHFFRIPSQLFPWAQEYELEELPGGWVGGAARGTGLREDGCGEWAGGRRRW